VNVAWRDCVRRSPWPTRGRARRWRPGSGWRSHRYRRPAPQLQDPVGPFLLVLAYPQIRLAIEYDGREHRTADRALRDLRHEAYLTRESWDVLRLEARVVFNPPQVAVRVHRELMARGAASPTPVGPPRW
jgi:very-short-patch-repair endonuclease